MSKRTKCGIYLAIISACFLLCSTLLFFQTSKKYKAPSIIYIPANMDKRNEFWSGLIAGAKMAAKEYGVDLTVMAPKSEADIEGQNILITEAIAKKPDAIIISPASYTQTTPFAAEVVKQRIPLIFVDSHVDEELADSIVSTNNIEAGRKLGEYMREFMPSNPHIALISYVKGVSTAIEREQGIRKGLGIYSDKVEHMIYCDSAFQNAYDSTIKLLSAHPEVNMIAGFNEYSAVGVAKAVRDLNLQAKIAVFGIDSSAVQIQFLEEGIYKGIVVQNSFNMGYLGVEQAYKDLTGKKVSRKVDAGSKLITKQEMYSEENQKLLFPFIGKQAAMDDEIKSSQK